MATEKPKLYQTNTFAGGMDTDTPDMYLDGTTYREAVNMRLGVDDAGVGVLSAIPLLELSTQLLVDSRDISIRLLLTFGFRQKSVHIVYGYVYWYVIVWDDEQKRFSKILKAKHSDWTVGDKVSAAFSYEAENNLKMYLANGSLPMLIIPLDKLSSGNNFVFGPDDINKLRAYPSALLKPIKINGVAAGNLIYGRVLYSYRLYNRFLNSSEAAIPTRQFPVVHYEGSGLSTKGGNVGENSNMGVNLEISIDSTDFEYIQIFRILYTSPNQKPVVYTIYDGKIDTINKKIIFSDTALQSLSQMSIEEFNTLSGIHIIPEAIDSKDDRLFAANIKEANTTIVDEIVKDYDTRAFRFSKDGNTYKSKLYQYGFDAHHEIVISNPQSRFIDSSIDLPDLKHDCYNKYNDLNDTQLLIGTGIDKYDLEGDYGGSGANISYKIVVSDLIGDSNQIDGGINHMYLQHGNIIATDNDVAFKVPIKRVSSYGEPNNIDTQYSPQFFGDTVGASYLNPIVNSSLPSLRRNEIYRYGIIFYDSNGNKSSVKWIADIRTPEVHEYYDYVSGKKMDWYQPPQNYYGDPSPFSVFTGSVKYKETDNFYRELVTHPIGILFLIRNLPEGIVAYEIVRANRTLSDIHNLTQGILYSVSVDDDRNPINTTDKYATIAPTITRFDYSGTNGTFGDIDSNVPVRAELGWLRTDIYTPVYLFASPEICYYENFEIGNKLLPLMWVFAETAKDGETTWELPDPKEGMPSQNEPRDPITYNVVLLAPSYFGFNISLKLDTSVDDLGRDGIHMLKFKLGTTKDPHTVGGGTWDFVSPINSIYADNFTVNPRYGYQIPGKLSLSPGSDYPQFVEFSLDEINSEASPILQTKKNLYEISKNSYAYLKFYNVLDHSPRYADIFAGGPLDIKNHVIAETLSWNELCDDKNNSLTYADKSVAIASYRFINFADGGAWKQASYDKEQFVYGSLAARGNRAKGIRLAGPGGRCMLLYLNDLINPTEANTNIRVLREYPKMWKFGPMLCNIQQTVSPYGGGSDVARKITSYNSYCDYHTANEESCIVFDGDTYIIPFEYVSLHKWYEPQIESEMSLRHMIVSATPVETSVDFVYSHGNEFSRNASNLATNLLEKPADVNDVYIQTDSLYKYNGAYSSANVALPYTAFDESLLSVLPNLDCRIYASEIKAANEYVDNWARFKALNYIDVDSKYGPVTNIRKFRDRLIYWQANATGVVSVNERLVLTSDSDTQLVIGSGGILTRYDYISLQYGMEPKSFNDTLSDNALYWINAKRDAILAYNSQVENIARTKKILNYIKGGQHQNVLCYYNPSHKEVVFCGLANRQYAYLFDPDERVISADTDEYASIIYNEDLLVFSHSDSRLSTNSLKTHSETFGGAYLWLVNKALRSINKYSDHTLKEYTDEGFVIYTVNQNPLQTKVFDTIEIGVNFAKTPVSELIIQEPYLVAIFKTSLGQRSAFDDDLLSNRESNNEIAIPRDGFGFLQNNPRFGNRLRGKTMSVLFSPRGQGVSLSYVTTKFRMSLA